MDIKPINNFTFQSSKKKFIFDSNIGDVQQLLKKMNKNVIINGDEYSFTSNIVKELSINNQVKFIDNRDITKPLPKNVQYQGFSTIIFNEATIDINNQTGEILNCNKNCNVKNDTILLKINKFLKMLINNYNDDSLVQKKWFCLTEITDKGINALSQIATKYKVS